jgi:rare lipoprotein A
MSVFKQTMLLLTLGLLTACANLTTNGVVNSSKGELSERKYGVASSPRLVAEHESNVPKGGGRFQVGKPYTIAGRVYTPFEKQEGHQEVGQASWYGRDFHGRKTANGEIFNMHSMSAAHRTMPLPAYARVTNQKNGRSIIVRVNDRGPFAHSRVLDLSSRAADLLDFKQAGHATVKVEYVGRAPLQGSNDKVLEASLRINQPAQMPKDNGSVMVASSGPVKIPPMIPVKIPEAAIEIPQVAPKSASAILQQMKPTPIDDEPVAALSQAPALPKSFKNGAIY